MKNSYSTLEENAKNHLIQAWPEAGTIGKEHRDFIIGGEGVYLQDQTGAKLIDGPGGMWCVNIGHGNKEIAQTMYEQALTLDYCSPWYSTADVAAELSCKLASYAPEGLKHTFFTTGGTSANETALRFVQFYNNVLGRKNKKKILTREDAYHGSSFLTGSLSGTLRAPDWMDKAEDLVVTLSSPNIFRRPKELSEQQFCHFLIQELIDTIEKVGKDNIAAFIGEPILGSGGVIVSPKGYFKAVQDICKQNDIIFIADEVVTAFGRLGHIFSSEHVFETQPDMICFAKGVTSGYFPFGGVMIAERFFEHLHESKNKDAIFAHGLTYSSHPIGCAVALKNLEILEKNHLLDHVLSLSDYFIQSLKKLEDLPLVGDVRGHGFMACVECVMDKENQTPLRLDYEVGARIDAHAQKKGLLLRPIYNMCVLSPPLIISKEQIDQLVQYLHEAIELTMRDLKKENLWHDHT